MTTPLPAGTIVAGRYRIEERLGEGGMGVVYRAVQLPLGRDVALKVLKPRLGTDEGARARFEREATVAGALDHPSALGIYDFGVDGERVFLAMELLSGRPLRRRLDQGMDLAEALDVAWQVSDVLVAAHRVSLVHRDLKPENIFLEDQGDSRRTRVVDFGLAFIAGGQGRSARMTVEGVVTGTPAYLSPEQARGGDVGPPTDIYALGCVMYEMLSGQVPFTGSEMDVLTRQMFAAPPPLREVRRDLVVPAALEELMMAMLRKPPIERPAAAAVRDQLSAIGTGSARGRGRDDSYLLGRSARMVSGAVHGAPALARTQPIEVAVVGQVGRDLVVALAANGIAAWPWAQGESDGNADAIYAPSSSPERVTELSATGLPVVSDTDASDMTRISELLRAGAAEVVVRPVAAEHLARRISRAVRTHRRRSSAG